MGLGSFNFFVFATICLLVNYHVISSFNFENYGKDSDGSIEMSPLTVFCYHEKKSDQ